MEIGTVISTFDSPSPSKFYFTVRRGIGVKKDQFVKVITEEGTLIASVVDVVKTNRYYAQPEAVVEAQNLEQLVPVNDWEFLRAMARPLGVITENGIERPSIPPSPGEKVYEVEKDLLFKFLGFDENGLYIGKLFHHDIEVKLNLTKLFQKHVAILAMSGAGKSYLTSVLIEELLDRKKELGRVSVLVFDVHGEYTSFAEKAPEGFVDYSEKAFVIESLKIPLPELSAYELSFFVPEMSPAQKAELDKVLRKLRVKLGVFDLDDVIREVRLSSIKEQTKNALLRWLNVLKNMGIFGSEEKLLLKRRDEAPFETRLRNAFLPGRALIFDLSKYIDFKKKQILVSWLAKKVFELRRANEIPPTVMILEEAHNFIPEGESGKEVIARKVFETIAREGRKFLCSLVVISQRPLRLSTTILSQCNTHIIMRITNPYDKRHIGESSEGISKEAEDALTTLQVGEALIVGEAVRYPVFVKIRKRRSWEKRGIKLEEEARKFEELMEEKSMEFNEAKEAFL